MFEQLKKMEFRYQELENLLASHELLADAERYNKLAKELSDLRGPVFLFREYKKVFTEIEDLEGMLKERHDRDFTELAKKELLDLAERKSALEAQLTEALKTEDKDADKDVIMEIRQGTGGSEAALFAADLYRMYTKYAASKGWVVETMSAHPTDVGGFKEIVFSVSGKSVHKRLRFESGVHRVQRVPDTEAQGRIHTSTATVVVMVEPEEVELVINPADLKIDTYRSSGPGGQHMQKTDSAVRITHVPTGTVVACQDGRSQQKNKAQALRVLRARLLDKKHEEESKRISDARKSQVGTGDRSEKIRTYNFPDRRITDHRINFTLYKMEAVLEGDLDELSDALIKASEEAARKAEEN
ncbi:MAG: peptide chain release factor 1 [Candidatus Omnitrophota bacterium]|jgi:peptide chain release factor 1